MQDEAGWKAVALLHHRLLTGLFLRVTLERGAAAAGDFAFHLFRRQHHEKFLPGIEKLGLASQPDAIKAAGYHYLANRIGGVKVEFMREHDRKAWVHFVPPRWIYDGAALCGIPTDVSRGVLRGWYGQNGPSLGNPNLGFVCTSQTTDGQGGLTGYFLEHDHPLAPDQRLRFAPGETAPPFDPDAAPQLDLTAWTEARLARARRTYAMDYIRTALPILAELFGPATAAHLGHTTARMVAMQSYDDIASLLAPDPGAEGFARLVQRLALAQDDDATLTPGPGLRQTTWRLMRGVPAVPDSVFPAWNGLLEGLLAVHDRFLRLHVQARRDRGDPAFEWTIRPLPLQPQHF
jgi:hypothetical protein